MAFTTKDIRIISNDIALLQSTKMYMPALTAFKLGLVSQLEAEVKTSNGSAVYLNEEALMIFKRVVELVAKHSSHREIVTKNDIYAACKSSLGEIIAGDRKETDGCVFITLVDATLQKAIFTYSFYSNFHGLIIDDLTPVRVGNAVLQLPDEKVIVDSDRGIESGKHLWEKFKSGLWIKSTILGSEDFASIKFFNNLKASTGILALALTSVVPLGSQLRLIPTIQGRSQPSPSRWFRIEEETNSLGDSVSKQGFMPASIPNSKMHELIGLGWFKQLDGAITNQNLSDLQASIKRAAFWFFEAQAETTYATQLVKYWSCIECIFSFEKNGKTTEKIITGLPAVLLNGPIPFPLESDIKKLKKQIDDLYDRRSVAVHDAQYDHVSYGDVWLVSQWASWLMINIAQLVENGYTTRAEIKRQTDRLSN